MCGVTIDVWQGGMEREREIALWEEKEERESIIRERERDKEERKILKKESHWLSATWQAGINKNSLDFS